ncbi:MAG: glycosyltransferase [Paracoccaceae bacterium]
MSDPNGLRVIIPARNAAWCINACLAGLARAGFAPGDIIVVDDGSTDATAALARGVGAVVIRGSNQSGAAAARNRGAAEVGGSTLFFVDADVVVHADARTRLMAFFTAYPEIDAIFGAYDDDPACPAPSSKYRNLLHHYVHGRVPRRLGSFWTGCGAVRRGTFDRLGGFDASQRMMEDVEFGQRLTAEGGAVVLDPALLGKHLKSWTVLNIARTDLFDRAIPWSRLMLFGPGLTSDLNLGKSHRLSAALTAVMWLSLITAPFAPVSLMLTAVACVAFIAANREFLRLVRRCAGQKAALAAVPLHLLHYSSALAGFGWVYLVEYLPHRLLASFRGDRPGPGHIMR